MVDRKYVFRMACAVWHPCHAMHIALRCCEKQINDARIIQYISNVLHAASRLKQCGLTLVKIPSRRWNRVHINYCRIKSGGGGARA